MAKLRKVQSNEHRPANVADRSAAAPFSLIAYYSVLRVPVGRPGRILTLSSGGKMPHVIACGSFATFEILRAMRFGPSEDNPSCLNQAGDECSLPVPLQEVAVATLRCLRQHVPVAVPGIVFLSGGQNDRIATAHLDAMNRLPGPKPWKSFLLRARTALGELRSTEADNV